MAGRPRHPGHGRASRYRLRGTGRARGRADRLPGDRRTDHRGAARGPRARWPGAPGDRGRSRRVRAPLARRPLPSRGRRGRRGRRGGRGVDPARVRRALPRRSSHGSRGSRGGRGDPGRRRVATARRRPRRHLDSLSRPLLPGVRLRNAVPGCAGRLEARGRGVRRGRAGRRDGRPRVRLRSAPGPAGRRPAQRRLPHLRHASAGHADRHPVRLVRCAAPREGCGARAGTHHRCGRWRFR